MKNIAVLTATRAEYGLLEPIIKKLKNAKNLNTFVVAFGMHLSPDFGMTYREIEKDGIKIDKKIETLLGSDTPAAVSKSMGLVEIGLADYFSEQPLDAILVLGDRYEIMAACCSATNARIPIFHMHGGETTEGAIDEAYRHSITKMSYLHFTSTDIYRKRVIQLGEDPERVFSVGAMGVENALHESLITKEELGDSLEFELNRYAVLTFHPVTLDDDMSERQAKEVIKAIDRFSDLQFIITKANADAGGRAINKIFSGYVRQHKNCKIVDSLGRKRYLSALKYSLFVMGNSSSGIIEAPSFRIPTVNIGNRQRGRVRASSVIDCECNENEIVASMRKALDLKESGTLSDLKNPYGDGNTSDKIVEIINRYLFNGNINLQKKFFDLDFRV